MNEDDERLVVGAVLDAFAVALLVVTILALAGAFET